MTKPSLLLRKRFHIPLLSVALFTAVLAAALTWLVAVHPFLPIDATIERDVQAVDVGPLLPIFLFYTSIGGPLGVVGVALLFAVVLLVNRPAWRLFVAAAIASGWYYLLSTLIIRARPSVPEVLRVTEHPGASSYPSGHMILFVFYAAILMLCIGYRFLPRGSIRFGWAAAVVLVVVGGVSRMYSGAHWPSDVIAGALIGVSWMSFVVAIRSISDPVVNRSSRANASTRSAVLPA